MNHIRVIVINPNNRTITEQFIEPTLQEFYKLIGCELIEANYEGIISKSGHFLYVDEEGTFKKDRNYFHITGAYNALCGIGVLMTANSKGDCTSAKMDIEKLRPFVKFFTQEELNKVLHR